MDIVQETICQTQGNIFRVACEQRYDMNVFVPSYMNSRFCAKNMDGIWTVYQFADAEECLDFILPEIQPPKLDKVVYNPAVMEWIGFTYRQLYLTLNISSKEIYDKVSFLDMIVYYPGLHTVDDEMAMDIIKEDKFSSNTGRRLPPL